MNLENTSLFSNRELSWLDFNERVLEEAYDNANPLMERLFFLAITASNLDEFFMVRVSALMQSESTQEDASGHTPLAALEQISKRAHAMMTKQYSCFTRSILPALEKEGIRFLAYDNLDEKQKKHVDTYYNDVIYQILTPMAIDQSRPFPSINNRTVNVFIELAQDDEAKAVRMVEWNEEENRWQITEERPIGPKFAIVQIPTVVPRIVPLPSSGSKEYILLENIILAHIDGLFLGHVVTRTGFLRVTRNSDIHIDEEDTDDLLDLMARSVRGRRWGDPVRFEISKKFSKQAMKLFEKALKLTDDMVYELSGPLDLTAWMGFAQMPEFASLRNKPLRQCPSPDFIDAERMFDVIKQKDVLVHHPYMSFDCVVRFVQEAAQDTRVLAIKQTLYRVSGQSPIVRALIKAAENGKQVSVLVELKARFDEENNINWAKLLEKSGVHVIYGLVGLKTHCKMCLVVRKEDDAIRRYIHLGTGNYNEQSAKVYTDLGFFTCRETFGQDASVLFNVLTGYSKTTDFQKFAVAPVNLRQSFMNLIEIETNNAKEGKPAAITARMNALTDVEIIGALYQASIAGVKINLLVRGTCCLKPGVPGVSANISVSSIIDRYLEHSRIYIFETGGNPRVFLSSADWMARNLNRRVEVLFPVEDELLKEELITQLNISLSDNVKRREAGPDGVYVKQSRRGKETIHSQMEHHKRTLENANIASNAHFLLNK